VRRAAAGEGALDVRAEDGRKQKLRFRGADVPVRRDVSDAGKVRAELSERKYSKGSIDVRLLFANNVSMALTPRQKEVLDFLVEYTERNGFSPSFEEIAAGLQLASLATVHKHITALEQKGYLKRRYNESRSIEVSPEYRMAERERLQTQRGGQMEVPLLGRIAAGAPVESVPSPEALSFSDFAGSADTYALQVRGDSMIEDHICSGDYVLVERAANVRDGEIVVALVDGLETTLKRFYREPEGMVRLQPANSAMDPIRVPGEHVELQGRVLAVLRKYR